MDIRKRIRDRLEPTARGRTVADVRIGLGYTAVMLDNSRTGLALTVLQEGPHGCSLFDGELPLEGRQAGEMLEMIRSRDRIETALGLATANALANTHGGNIHYGDILEFIRPRPTDRVGMVGMFGPLLEPLRERAKEVIVFERDRTKGDDFQPETEIREQLPRCDIALITATSIVNHSMDGFLHAAANCREAAILGPTTPLLPDVFRDTPVTCLSGVIVSNPAHALRVVSSAGGMRQLKRFVDKVNLPLRAW
jgi:uncharacterized protein (DUF4213/DUF364 family)